MKRATKEYVKRYRQRLKGRAFALIGTECIFCHNKVNLHAAHIKSTGLNGKSRGLDRRFRDVIKHPDCYKPMCKQCHQVFDRLVNLSKPDDAIPF